MSGRLNHSPADVGRKLLERLGVGTDADLRPLQAWPVYAGGEPDTTDSCLTVYDTEGSKDGRSMIDGETFMRHGIQVRIRAASHNAGFVKGNAITEAFDKSVSNLQVSVGSSSYLISSISRTSDVLSLRKEGETGRRHLFTVNALMFVRMYGA